MAAGELAEGHELHAVPHRGLACFMQSGGRAIDQPKGEWKAGRLAWLTVLTYEVGGGYV